MVNRSTNDELENAWLLDSRYSNHMIGLISIFNTLDESIHHIVKLGNNKALKMASIGSVVFRLKSGNLRELNNVQYILDLAHNLLRIGQLLNSGCYVVFSNQDCIIGDKESDTLFAWVHMTEHKLFKHFVDEIGSIHVAACKDDVSSL